MHSMTKRRGRLSLRDLAWVSQARRCGRVLVEKTRRALEAYPVKQFVLAGVAQGASYSGDDADDGRTAVTIRHCLCGDNAAMIELQPYTKYMQKDFCKYGFSLNSDLNWG